MQDQLYIDRPKRRHGQPHVARALDQFVTQSQSGGAPLYVKVLEHFLLQPIFMTSGVRPSIKRIQKVGREPRDTARLPGISSSAHPVSEMGDQIPNETLKNRQLQANRDPYPDPIHVVPLVEGINTEVQPLPWERRSKGNRGEYVRVHSDVEHVQEESPPDIEFSPMLEKTLATPFKPPLDAILSKLMEKWGNLAESDDGVWDDELQKTEIETQRDASGPKNEAPQAEYNDDSTSTQSQ